LLLRRELSRRLVIIIEDDSHIFNRQHPKTVTRGQNEIPIDENARAECGRGLIAEGLLRTEVVGIAPRRRDGERLVGATESCFGNECDNRLGQHGTSAWVREFEIFLAVVGSVHDRRRRFGERVGTRTTFDT
jgi:hypothetical protein